MTIHFQDHSITVHHGDCLDVLREIPDESVDVVVTDPPYGLSNTDPARVAETVIRWVNGERDYIPGGAGFMGNEWDAFVPPVAVWDECLRVLKPGGHALAFAGSRTHDLMTLGLRLAGFEIREALAWLYGSGFPKSLDVSKAIDKAADYRLQAAVRRAAVAAVETAGLTLPGNSRHDWTIGEHAPGDKWWAEFQRWLPDLTDVDRERIEGEIVATVRKAAGWFTRGDIYEVTAPATPEAEAWQGWGTALKPAYEPIVMGRKPLTGTVAANVLEHGTGALNIDACRVETYSAGPGTTPAAQDGGKRSAMAGDMDRVAYDGSKGRWPANVILDEHTADLLDQQSGELTSGANPTRRGSDKFRDAYGEFTGQEECTPARGADSGGASRFFYVAKAPTSERPRVDGIAHPTVKPLDLMQWLVRLVTPSGGTVLEPFAGSGTTVEACILEGFSCIAIEREADYLPLIVQRINRRRDPVEAVRATGEDMGLFGLLSADDPHTDRSTT